MNKQLWFLTVLMMTSLLLDEAYSAESPFDSQPNLQVTKSFGDYTVEIYREEPAGDSVLRIVKNGKEIFSRDGHVFRLGLIETDDANNKLVGVGSDITGDSVPDLVISEWSGGAHCCFTYYVFSIGSDFKLMDKIEAQDAGGAIFQDIDNDGQLEFLAHDFVFAYWHSSFAASPAPEVVLKFKDGRYRLALDLMRKPLPSIEDEEKIVQQLEKEHATAKSWDKSLLKFDTWTKGDVTVIPMTWGHMLDLIYSGHANEAWRFLDRVWEGDEETKAEFIADFRSQLSQSNYWDHQFPVNARTGEDVG